jgi:hypothetical protein
MFGISVDLTPAIEEFNILAEEVSALTPRILDRVIDSYMTEWEDNINQSLGSTRNEYKRSMYVERIDEKNAIIGLTPRESSLALMLEDGATSFDIKEGMEKSSKKKYTEDGGWYITVPFRHATSEALAESTFFQSKMPKSVERVVQSKTMEGGRTQGVKIDELPAEYQKLRSNPTTGYQHKSPIYEGLTRLNMPSSEKEKRSGYFTFRRISSKSDPDSWVHPGFKALKLMEKTLQQINAEQIVDEEVNNFLLNR